MARVIFLQGTAAGYAALTPVANTFYATTDTNELYFGSKKLTNAADLASAISRIAANEGAITEIQSDLTTINGDDTTEGSMLYIAKAAADALDAQLEDVAKSGAAEDVSVADTAGKLTATDVEAALAEIVGMVENVESAGEVTIQHTAGTLVYDFYQGGTDVSNKIGSIVLPEDMVATAGQLVHPDSEHPIIIDGETITSGAYIMMTIANADPFYIDVVDLIEYNDVQSTAEIVLSNTNHVISGTIGEISGTKLSAGSVAYAKLDSGVQASLDAADSAVQSVAEGATNGTVAVDGTDVAVHGLGSAAYTASTAYDAAGTGAAEAAAVLGESTDTASAATVYGAKAAAAAADSKAQGAVDLIGEIPSTSEADTVIEYVDEQTAGGISGLTGSAAIASAVNGVVTLKAGVTQTAGVISNSSDSDVVLAKAATTGAAVDIGITDSGDLFTGSEVETALAESMTAANAAQSDVDSLETLVGTLPSGITATTVTGYIAEAAAAATLEWEAF